jgi:hypothetical protein
MSTVVMERELLCLDQVRRIVNKLFVFSAQLFVHNGGEPCKTISIEVPILGRHSHLPTLRGRRKGPNTFRRTIGFSNKIGNAHVFKTHPNV